MKVRATDIHGFFTETYIIIKIDDYKPERRSKYRDQFFDDDIYIIENTEFNF